MAIDQNDPRVQEYLRQQEEEQKKPKPPPQKPPKQPKPTVDSGKDQRRVFKRKRAGVVLTRDEVKAIKAGRKKLRREMRQMGLKKKKDFELTASSLGLYFDKRHGALLAWLWSHWLGGLLALLGLLLLVFSTISHARGFFTINLTEGMFREGFTLSETRGFENPTVQLFATPAENVPCVSISHIPTDVDDVDGEHNHTYFAYTWYLRNEGETTVDYDWELSLTAESLELSDALWVMFFEDGEMRLFAKANELTGQPEALPAFDDNSRGYRFLPIRDLAPQSDQFQIVKQNGTAVWWRVVPDTFVSDSMITTGYMPGVDPMEVHRYTVVLWLEGDDPDATDELIGGHAGVTMQFYLSGDGGDGSSNDRDDGLRGAKIWDDLRFWDNWSFWGD